MKITPNDFKNINLHGLTVVWHEWKPGNFEASIDLHALLGMEFIPLTIAISPA